MRLRQGFAFDAILNRNGIETEAYIITLLLIWNDLNIALGGHISWRAHVTIIAWWDYKVWTASSVTLARLFNFTTAAMWEVNSIVDLTVCKKYNLRKKKYCIAWVRRTKVMFWRPKLLYIAGNKNNLKLLGRLCLDRSLIDACIYQVDIVEFIIFDYPIAVAVSSKTQARLLTE